MKFSKFNLKNIFLILICLVLIFSINSAYSFSQEGLLETIEKNKININDKTCVVAKETLLKEAFLHKNEKQLMLPLRKLLENLEYEIHWNNKDSSICIYNKVDSKEKIVSFLPPKNQNEYDDRIDFSGNTTFISIEYAQRFFEFEKKWTKIELENKESLIKEHLTNNKVEGLENYKLKEYIKEHRVLLLSRDGPVKINKETENKIIEKLIRKAQAYLQDKTAYLTFDDGPSYVTPGILNILAEYNVPATFFVIGKNASNNPSIVQRIKNEGHSIGNHTFTHDYDKVYNSPGDLKKEIEKANEVIKNIVGEETEIFRPPGGPKPYLTPEKIKVINELGYNIYNWNVSGGDSALPPPSKKTILENIKYQVEGQEELIILLHDSRGKTTTKNALPGIIEFLKEQGYNFCTLS